MTLTYYEKYWEHTSSDPAKERKRLSREDIGGKGDPIGAQTAMVQDDMLENLKSLFDQAGIEDWVAHIDHTLTYQAQKQEIIEDFGAEGFAIDKKEKLERLEEEQSRRREEAPDDAPMTQEERMKKERFGEAKPQLDDNAETTDISESATDSPDSSSDQKSMPNNNFLSDTSQNLSLDGIRNTCTQELEQAYRQKESIIIDALPGMGKSYSAIEAVDTTDTQITILVDRGHEEQYEQIQNWCEKIGVSYKILPSSRRECPTISGKHGKSLAKEQKQYLSYGLTASSLHAQQDLPCENNDNCAYIDAWNFQPSDFDIIIGHYSHAHVEDIIEDRIVVFDEFPDDTFVTKIENEDHITNFLQDSSGIPFNNYTDLISNRNNTDQRKTAIDWFRNRGFGLRQINSVLLNNLGSRHALAPLGVLALLQTGDLNNGWEGGPLREGERAAFNQQNASIFILRPPTLSQAEGVIALSGTPVYRLWELVLGVELDAKQVLSNEERREYVWNIQDLQIIQTERKHVYPYSSGNYVNTDRDSALIKEIQDKHNTIPTVITSKNAKKQIEKTVQIDSDSPHFGNIRGSNKLQQKGVGLILGSPHPGDNEIKKWAAFFGIEASRQGSGTNLSFGAFGDKVLKHFRENEILQSVFRFGRDGSGATVYVNTAAVPSWLPRQWAVGFDRKRTDAELSVIEELKTQDQRSGADIANAAGIHPNTARDQLNKLENEGFISKSGKSRGTKWHDVKLDSINKSAHIDLSPIFTEPVYNMYIRDLGDKLPKEIQESIMAEQAKERRIIEQEIEEIRDPSSNH